MYSGQLHCQLSVRPNCVQCPMPKLGALPLHGLHHLDMFEKNMLSSLRPLEPVNLNPRPQCSEGLWNDGS